MRIKFHEVTWMPFETVFRRFAAVVLLTTALVVVPLHAQETIVAIRHAEKPAEASVSSRAKD